MIVQSACLSIRCLALLGKEGQISRPVFQQPGPWCLGPLSLRTALAGGQGGLYK